MSANLSFLKKAIIERYVNKLAYLMGKDVLFSFSYPGGKSLTFHHQALK